MKYIDPNSVETRTILLSNKVNEEKEKLKEFFLEQKGKNSIDTKPGLIL